MAQANYIYTRQSNLQQTNYNVIKCDGLTEWVTVYFKEAFTDNRKNYNIPIKWTIEQFINIVKEWIMEDFDIANRDFTTCSISIIEAAQEIPGTKAEDSPCMVEEQITYYDKYIINNRWPAFYIKINLNKN